MQHASKPKVSVLVPCYNVEKYLPQCLDSIVNQTLKDIEIICINDGSTDSTLQIIEKYAKRDKRILIIDKENEGYGKSMNRGLDAATGAYVGIVESDDWVALDAFETLYNAAVQNDADMVKADFVFFDDGTKRETPGWGFGIADTLKERVFNPTKQNIEIIWSGHPSIWTCLYRNQMLKNYKIRFAETPGASFQDMGFKPKTFIAAKRFYYIPRVVLHYRKHANNSDKNNAKVFAICDVHDDTDEWLRANMPNAHLYYKIANQCRFCNYLWNLHRLHGAPKREFSRRFRQEFKALYKTKNLNHTYFDTRTRLKLLSIIYPWNPFFAIFRMIGKITSPLYRTKIHNGYKTTYLFNNRALKQTAIIGVN